MAAAGEQGAFVLCVFLTFQKEEDRDHFLHQQWAPLAAWVRANEPGTLAYECSVGDQDPLSVLVYERYSSREYFREVHQTSKPYLAFKEASGEWRKEHAVEVSGKSYFETGLGHMAPAGQA